MATKRIKDLTNTAASVASDAYLAIDGTSNGTEKITRDNFRQDTADAFVAAPGTYNLAPLSGGAVEVAKGGTGATTAAGARTNLSVNSKDEDAQAYALKTTAPSMYFNGSSSDITVAADPKFAFTDGTNDLPFTVEGFVKADSVGNTFLFGLHEASSTKRQFACYVSATNKLRLELVDSTGDACYNDTDTTLLAYNGQWLHVASVYTGADASTFGTTAPDNVTHYVNGSAVASTGFPNVNYGGMSDTGAVGYIGRFSNTRGQQHVRSVRVYNRALLASEIAELARGNDLGFSEEWGGGTATSGTLTIGKRYRLRDWITGDDFTNVGAGSNADGVEFVATGTTPTTWTNSSVVESIGTLADFRAEDYNESASKLLDRSSNNFVGVGTSVTLTGNKRHLSADTIDLKNLPTSSAGLSAGEVWSNSGVLTVV